MLINLIILLENVNLHTDVRLRRGIVPQNLTNEHYYFLTANDILDFVSLNPD